MSDKVDPEDILNNYLKANKDDHYNFEETVEYKISSGSLQLDLYMAGGFGPGLHRFTGVNEGGKTSESLQVMKNFILHGFFKVIIVDSVDGLIRKDDFGKNFEESSKVAGGAVIASDFCKKTSTALGKRGHMAIFISQVRADIKLDPYSKAPVRQTTATGGNALLHYANNIMEFEPRFKGDLILKNPTVKTMDAKKNPIIGHHAKVTIKKSAHENTNTTVSYPIRYGRTGGTSIWVEKEIVDLLYAWEFIEKKGAWIKPTDEFKELLEAEKLDFPEKIQGDNNLFKTIEESKDLCLFLIDYFKKQIGV